MGCVSPKLAVDPKVDEAYQPPLGQRLNLTLRMGLFWKWGDTPKFHGWEMLRKDHSIILDILYSICHELGYPLFWTHPSFSIKSMHLANMTSPCPNGASGDPNPSNPVCWMDIEADDKPVGRIEVELKAPWWNIAKPLSCRISRASWRKGIQLASTCCMIFQGWPGSRNCDSLSFDLLCIFRFRKMQQKRLENSLMPCCFFTTCPSLGALFHSASGGKLPGTLHRGAGIWVQRPGKSTSFFWIECILFDISRSWHATGIDQEACLGFWIFRFQIPSNHPSVHVPGKAVVGEVEASQLDYPLVN